MSQFINNEKISVKQCINVNGEMSTVLFKAMSSQLSLSKQGKIIARILSQQKLDNETNMYWLSRDSVSMLFDAVEQFGTMSLESTQINIYKAGTIVFESPFLENLQDIDQYELQDDDEYCLVHGLRWMTLNDNKLRGTTKHTERKNIHNDIQEYIVASMIMSITTEKGERRPYISRPIIFTNDTFITYIHDMKVEVTPTAQKLLMSLFALIEQPKVFRQNDDGTGLQTFDPNPKKNKKTHQKRPNQLIQIIDLRLGTKYSEIYVGSQNIHKPVTTYTHRWLVKGHWRNQHYPSLHINKPIWIAPYIKGPEDAPFADKTKIYRVTP